MLCKCYTRYILVYKNSGLSDKNVQRSRRSDDTHLYYTIYIRYTLLVKL